MYTGSSFTFHFKNASWNSEFGLNINLADRIPNGCNFVGLELNSNFASTGNQLGLKAQMRSAINEHLLVGRVSGIPIRNRDGGLSSFIRLI